MKATGKFSFDPMKCVRNYSSLQIPLLGPKFYYPVNKTKQLDKEVEFENLLTQVTDLVPLSLQELEKPKSTLISARFQHRGSKPSVKGIVNTEQVKMLFYPDETNVH